MRPPPELSLPAPARPIVLNDWDHFLVFNSITIRLGLWPYSATRLAYSDRSVTTGSTDSALRTGTAQAIIANMPSRPAPVANIVMMIDRNP
jgi:hypothetical protein